MWQFNDIFKLIEQFKLLVIIQSELFPMMLVSSAFPPGKNPPKSSKVHQQLTKHLQNFPLPNPTIRRHQQGDLEQLKLLQREWFPLNYTESFYNKIRHGLAHCFVAQILITPDSKQNPQTAIVGAIVFEVVPQTQHLEDKWLNRMLSLNQNAIYIMTLGVIDEMRSKGLAQKLLAKLLDFSASNDKLKLISLHVVSYNKRAINFYRKNGFVLLQVIDDHYHIMGIQYSGLKLGYFVNGGQKRQGWIPWLKRVFLRKTEIDSFE